MITQEDKELLLQDLCSRLPYGVKIRLGDYDYQVCGYNSEKEMPIKIWYYYDSNPNLKSYIDVYLTDYRPYLRPMSSMTIEEHQEWIKYSKADYDCEFQPEPTFDFESCILSIDWLNQHHFDYNNLIEKGLAIKVTKENNPYEKK